ncbi:type II toxin-antitoxin system RelB/DinJ family antitoxin [Lactobacillus delbrueckii]|uniref:type II toxin-antitoxin system RelB/DinJ family antitoxin n=1 Tax=Lactobacillus TaxID=1578 RepID=UPI0039967EFF
MASSQVNFKMDSEDKKEVTAIFNYYGLDLSTGIKMYLKKVQHSYSIPLDLTMEDTELGQAIKDAKEGNFVGEYDSVESFVKAMNDEN